MNQAWPWFNMVSASLKKKKVPTDVSFDSLFSVGIYFLLFFKFYLDPDLS